jgi:hypothetical protein
MKKVVRRYLIPLVAGLVVIGAMGAWQTVSGQNRIEFLPSSTLVVDGTSNQSDWTVTADSLYGWVNLAAGTDGMPSISSAELHVIADEIVSNKSPIMDRLMRRALKTSEFSEIVFTLNEADVQPLSEADTFAVASRGQLAIAGETRDVEIGLGGERTPSGFRFAGSYEMNMTDFGIDPPTALFGALHTGDGVVVRFDLRIAVD